MTATTDLTEVKNEIRKCKTLDEADDQLIDLVKSRAMRWGMWDGFTGRPKSLAGLAPFVKEHEDVPAEIMLDYKQGYEFGKGFTGKG